jgi:low molecular weight protein-tyrosine phosphatase
MISILVVCGGNQCRSPIAEAFLRSRLHERLGSAAPTVASAGTIARTGAPATPETVMVAREHGLDASTHEAAAIRPEMLTAADVVLTMTADQRDAVRTMSARAATKTFTVKEAVGLLEQLPAVHQPPEPDQVRLRLAEADAYRRRRGIAPVDDEDVIDPIGQPMQTHRAVAWELAELCDRLVDGLFGSAEETTESAGKAS